MSYLVWVVLSDQLRFLWNSSYELWVYFSQQTASVKTVHDIFNGVEIQLATLTEEFLSSCFLLHFSCLTITVVNSRGSDVTSRRQNYLPESSIATYKIHNSLKDNNTNRRCLVYKYRYKNPVLNVTAIDTLWLYERLHPYTSDYFDLHQLRMMTESNGNIAHTKASDAELWCFLWSASEESVTLMTPTNEENSKPFPSFHNGAFVNSACQVKRQH